MIWASELSCARGNVDFDVLVSISYILRFRSSSVYIKEDLRERDLNNDNANSINISIGTE